MAIRTADIQPAIPQRLRIERELIMRCTRTLSHRPTTSLVHRHPTSRGFTLVEMLVAVTLVLLMMAMFAEIFQIAGGSIAKTRGLAENDQRSRTLQTIIKADLDKRSFRWVYPFAADEDASAPEANIGNRQGYFYVSENNPNNALDDVLQFTVVSTITSRNKDESPYYGQALNLAGFTYPNQPDADDGQLNSNNTGLSTVAEVVYFVRNGNLYRRQLLVREPLAMAGTNAQPDDSIPVTKPIGKNVFDPTVVAPLPAFQYSATGPFWNDFDYSAYYDEVPAGTSTGAHFLGADSLSNSGNSSLGAIAAPFRRFGHHHFGSGVTSGHAGRPKEFSADDVDAEFIGRFTLQECSDLDFRYPHNRTFENRTPTDPVVVMTLDPNNKTIIDTGTVFPPPSPPAPPRDDFSQGARRGEDLLLSNVHAFDILVWDDNYGGFVNIGDPNLPTTSDYYISATPATTKRRNASYGPRLPATATASTTDDVDNAVFDTWHPFLDVDGVAGNDEPPFRATTFRPDYSTVGTEPTKPDWEANKTYTSADIGTIVFPTVGAAPDGFPFYYRLISVDKPPTKGKGTGLLGANSSGDTEPIWPHAAELQIEDNALTWQAVDNRKPLKAVKLEVRFMDASTQQLRQLTIIHSLVD